jgi:hypothetical protein
VADTNESLAQSADALTSFSESVTGTILQVASGTFEGAGAYDPEDALCRFVEPLDLQSIDPPSAWDDLPRVLRDIFVGMSVREVVDSALRGDEWNTLISSPLIFAGAARDAAVGYFESQFRGYISLLTAGWGIIRKGTICNCALLQAGGASLADLIMGDDPEPLQSALENMRITVATRSECRLVLEVLEVLIKLRDAWDYFKGLFNDLAALWDDVKEGVGEIALLLAEYLRDAEIQAKIIEVRQDAEKLGAFYGTIIAFVVWEILEVFLTAGLGKGAKLVRAAF